MKNEYIPFPSQVKEIIRHTDIEYTFRMGFVGNVKPGQFFEVSIPKYGEAPISVSGIGKDTVDLTIRRVGKVTGKIFEHFEGNSLLMRGPYGNGFDIEKFKGKEVIIIAGGTGISPVKGIVDHFSQNPQDAVKTTLIAGFKSPDDILFKEDFKEWEKNLKVIQTVDAAPEGYEGLTGMVTKYIPDLPLMDILGAVFITVGPPIMIQFTIQEILKRGVPEENIWISHERKMCCGLGKCGHCKMDGTYICLDGPVFNYSEGKNLID
ncbi:MAG: anaerobic sulfite reductase subunit B [Lachnospiraceae bacterium]|nr:anaerobic sulfite reductase subunit B [Lachnospiraceae bacterium]